MAQFVRKISSSEDETIEIGTQIALHISDDIVILLIGSLGVGKSVLARGIARGLGYQGRIKSPSFTIERIYDTPKGEFHHWDMYRLENSSEIEPIFDQIRSQKGIRVVEWGERLDNFTNSEYPLVRMSFTDDPDIRELQIDTRLVAKDNQ